MPNLLVGIRGMAGSRYAGGCDVCRMIRSARERGNSAPCNGSPAQGGSCASSARKAPAFQVASMGVRNQVRTVTEAPSDCIDTRRGASSLAQLKKWPCGATVPNVLRPLADRYPRPKPLRTSDLRGATAVPDVLWECPGEGMMENRPDPYCATMTIGRVNLSVD